MKRFSLSLIVILCTCISYTGVASNTDTTKLNRTFNTMEKPPEYPGGSVAFGKHITKNLKYPEVARLIGINGRVVLTFVVERDGRVGNITPISCIGAGCESEAVKVIESSKTWKPGIQDGKPVRVQYSVPINFSIGNGKVNLKDLRASNYGFIFKIKDTLYTIDEAQDILGKAFQSTQVEIAEPFYNADNDPKFIMPDKKEVYVIKMKE